MLVRQTASKLLVSICLLLFVMRNIGTLDGTSFSWYSNSAAEQRRPKGKRTRPALVVDMISVGTTTRPHLQSAQKRTFATHVAVRRFLAVTESDDAEPNCTRRLRHAYYLVSNYCTSGKQWSQNQSIMQYWKGQYASGKWLRRKGPGWVCAQVRPALGFAKILYEYQTQQQQQQQQQQERSPVLPDYLVIMDDDTYINVELFQDFLNMTYKNSSIPRVIAGCRFRSNPVEFNITFPFGGFGTILSRGAIQNAMQPIDCAAPENAYVEGACRRIKQNLIGEGPLFRPNMSLVDLMYAYSTAQPFAKIRHWKTGFCLHSDWMLGYFFNFYNISVQDPDWKSIHHFRLHAYNGSEYFMGKHDTMEIKQNLRQCNQQGDSCKKESHICHYQDVDRMENLHTEARAMFPDGSFRSS